MFELFVVGTMWFWLLLLVELVLLFLFVAYENGLGATISMLAFVGLLQFGGGVDVVGMVVGHPLLSVGTAFLYLVIGIGWGYVKWRFYVLDELDEYEDLKRTWLRGKGITGSLKNVPDGMKASWRDYLGNWENQKIRKDPPVARDNKAKIIGWMSMWLPSMACTFLNDFIRRIYLSIYYKIADDLQIIADKMFAHVKNDFPE